MTRVEALNICGFDLRVWTLLPPTPLRKLDITLNKTGGSRRADANLNLPTVATLTVRDGDTFPFDVPQVTKLQVHSGETLTIYELFHLLNHCPLLEELEIGYDLGAITRGEVGTVEHPHLRLYNYHTSINTHLVLFDRLCIPPSCSAVGTVPQNRANLTPTPFYNPSPLGGIK